MTVKFIPVGDDDDLQGSCFQGRITTTYARLVEVFGPPNAEIDMTKQQVCWAIRFADGTIATVYDYDAVHPPKELTAWEIGGFRGVAVELVEKALAGTLWEEGAE